MLKKARLEFRVSSLITSFHTALNWNMHQLVCAGSWVHQSPLQVLELENSQVYLTFYDDAGKSLGLQMSAGVHPAIFQNVFCMFVLEMVSITVFDLVRKIRLFLLVFSEMLLFLPPFFVLGL